MAKNWLAYEAVEALYNGTDKEVLSEIGSRYPLLTRTACLENSDYLLDILKALPKVTARVVETGLKELEGEVEAGETEVEEVEEVEEAPKKETKAPKATKKVEADEEEESESDYSSMTSGELYKECCARGISSLCKSRSKSALIELLEKFDAGEIEATKGKKKEKAEEPKQNKAKATKKAEPIEEDDDWDDEEEEEEADPYKGKTAKELYKMCTDRGIKTKPKQSADVYAKLLKKADAEAEAETEDEDEEDDWEI